MSLRKLIYAATLALFLLGFTSAFFVSMYNVQSTLQSILRVQTVNAANTLAFSLSQPEQQNAAAQKTVIEALFETGNYHAITFLDKNNQVILHF